MSVIILSGSPIWKFRFAAGELRPCSGGYQATQWGLRPNPILISDDRCASSSGTPWYSVRISLLSIKSPWAFRVRPRNARNAPRAQHPLVGAGRHGRAVTTSAGMGAQEERPRWKVSTMKSGSMACADLDPLEISLLTRSAARWSMQASSAKAPRMRMRAIPFVSLLVTPGGGGDGEAMVDWVLRTNPMPTAVSSIAGLRPRSQTGKAADCAARHEAGECRGAPFEANIEPLIRGASGIVAMGGYAFAKSDLTDRL